MKAFLPAAFLSLALGSQGAVADDVVVTVPNFSATTITLHGVSGKNQDDDYKIFKLSLDSNGNYLPLPQTNSGETSLGTPLDVDAGDYIISYSNTYKIVHIDSGQKYSIKLRKVKVPEINRQYHFSIATDMAKADKANLLGQISQRWSTDNSSLCTDADTLVQNGNAAANNLTVQFCALIRAKNFAPFSDFYIKNLITSDGREKALGSDGNFTISTVPLVDPYDGDFISVLPGAYLLEFQDMPPNQRSETKRVQVN